MTALNMQPITPLNSSLGGGLKPAGPGFGQASPLGAKPKSVFDKIDVGRIGKGRLLVEGSYKKELATRRYSGLKGQLAQMQWSGRRGTTKNLSQKNVEQIHDMIAGRLKKKAVGTQTSISRRDKMAIMQQSRKLVKTAGSDFTWEDRKDLLRTVNSLQRKFKERILHGEDNPESAVTSSAPLSENPGTASPASHPGLLTDKLAETRQLPPETTEKQPIVSDNNAIQNR